MTIEVGGVTLGVEHFGDQTAPLVLLAGGSTMLSWPDALRVALARGGRHVVRWGLRGSGASTTVDPSVPAYTLRDLAADAAALARALDDRPAHLAGIGVGGMVAQVAALDHPDVDDAAAGQRCDRPIYSAVAGRKVTGWQWSTADRREPSPHRARLAAGHCVGRGLAGAQPVRGRLIPVGLVLAERSVRLSPLEWNAVASPS